LQCVAECCSVLQSVAECCRMLQNVAVCCSVLQCVAVWCIVPVASWRPPCDGINPNSLRMQDFALRCSRLRILQCVAEGFRIMDVGSGSTRFLHTSFSNQHISILN